MSDKRPDASGMTLGDVYFILFRQKWVILSFSLLGILGAGAFCLLRPPQYQSDAELSIPYVVEGKSLNASGEETRPLNEQSDSIIKTELEILQSMDLAAQVVQTMTPEKILAKINGGSDTNQAAYIVRKGLTVEANPGSSVIALTFQHPDPQVVQPTLNAIIDAYFTRHFQMHQGVGMYGDFLTNETIRLRAELAKTEKELNEAETQAGVVSSVEDAKKGYADQISRLREEIFSAKAELEERQATLQELIKISSPGSSVETQATNVEATAGIPPEQMDAYKRISLRLQMLEKQDMDYWMQGFTSENVRVKEVRGEMADAEKQKKDLETKYPKLLTSAVVLPNLAGQQPGSSIDLVTPRVQITAVESRINSLESQLNRVWVEATNFDRVEASILELQQKKEMEQANLNNFVNGMEQSRIDEALGGGKASNISIIQSPTPAWKGWSKKFEKKVATIAGGGIVFGVALAFLIELFLDRSIRRPVEIETKLRLPLFISIPAWRRNGRRLPAGGRRLALNDAPDIQSSPAETGVAPWDRSHALRPFYEGLRDRLMVYFEVRNLVHKPKLVAVTSCNKGAGVSSIAAGLAASLSETGDGNVLLVSMTGDHGAAHQFYKGKLGCGLSDALEAGKMKSALIGGNLYVAAERMDNDRLSAALPKRFTGLMPKLKASEYDYIIFDMPPVTQTSVTPRLAGLMDMVLLVIESEKTSQDVVKQVNQLLSESKAKVSTVLNKVRTYVPARLHQEFLNGA